MVGYFIWNGTDSRDYGIKLDVYPEIIKPKERVEHVTIPGRSGDLTLKEGDYVYEPYIQTVPFHVYGKLNAVSVEKWLYGSGNVIFCTQPDFSQRAEVIGDVHIKHSGGFSDWWEGTVTFYCQPYKHHANEASLALTMNSNVNNFGELPCYPLFTLRDLTVGSVVTFTIGGQTMVIDMTGRTEDGLIIDSEAQIVTTLDGSTNLTALSSGEFPVLPAGLNYATGENWVRGSVKLRRRYK